jgi:hypothetical protein
VTVKKEDLVMLPKKEALFSQDLHSDEKLLWSGKPQRGLFSHRFSIILVILTLFFVALIGGLIMLDNMTNSIHIMEILTTGSKFKFTIIGLLASFFIGLGLISFWSFVFYPIERRNTTYILTNQRVLIFSKLLWRKVKSFDLNSINFTSLIEQLKDRATIIFGEVDPIQYGMTDPEHKQRIINNWKWIGYKFQLFEVGWRDERNNPSPTKPVLGRFEHIENARMVYKLLRENAQIELHEAPYNIQTGSLAPIPVYVKRPGAVTFVVDISASMMGEKLRQAKKGLIGALDMAQNNQVGLLSFSDCIEDSVRVAPLVQNRRNLTETIGRMSASGCTALYEAIKEGIEMTDSADSPAEDLRAVVVLTDGQANQGKIHLDNIIKMKSRDGRIISKCTGFENDKDGFDSEGRVVGKTDILGSQLAIETRHPIQIYFIGIGNDADMEIGRILAEASGAESQRGFEVPKVQRIRDVDIARVLEEFKYF